MEGKLKAKTVTADDEGRCKAAAWAWYQHGKGTPSNGGMACRTLNSAVRRASRFKVEAMREQGRFVEGWTEQELEQQQHHHQQHHQQHHKHMHKHEQEQGQHHQHLYEQQEREEHGRAEMASGHEHEEEEEHAEPAWDCGSSLFDSYELFALSRQLDHAFVKASGANHAVHEPHFVKKSQKLGKILKMMPRGPRPLCRSEVMLQHPAHTHDPDLEGHLPGCKCHRHGSEEEHHYGYRDQEEHGGYAEHGDWEEDHHGAHNYHHKDADHHHRRRHGHGHGHGHGKHHWSFRKLSRALLMLAHKPTSVSHHNDEAQGHHHHNRGADSEDFHHQHHHEHYHEHDYHHQHEFRHQHEFHHYHHVHHIIQASPKLGYDVSEPPKFHSDG